MRIHKNTSPVTVSILAHNPKTNRVERLIHVGRVSSPATSLEILKLVRRALRARSTRPTF
jgi:hypothetical protein